MLLRYLLLVLCLISTLRGDDYLPHILPGFEYEKECNWEEPFFFHANGGLSIWTTYE